VLERVIVRSRALIGATAPYDASDVDIEIEATGDRPVFAARAPASVAASVYAPSGDIALGGDGTYQGRFVARRVRIGARARVTGLDDL